MWTLKAGENGGAPTTDEETGQADVARARVIGGLSLDYDTARKLAQALGAHLESLDHPGGIVEVKGSAARLRSVTERKRALMGSESARRVSGATLFDSADGVASRPVLPGATTLDRLHQAMLLFGDGRGDALRRLLAEPGYVSDEGFMRLARSLSALYPASSQEKRWIDGVLATRAR